MSKSKRLIELMMTINTKRKFTVGELAEEFQVSKRTILRDLQELSEAGLPLYSETGANGGYQMLKEKILPPIVFSENDAIAMFFAYQALENYPVVPFHQQSLSALKKFYQYVPSETRKRIDELQTRFAFWTPEHHLSLPYLTELLEFAVSQHIVEISYASRHGIEKRRIQPIGIFASNGLWYCPAYCFTRKTLLTFRVDRIHTLTKSVNQQDRQKFDKLSIQQYLRKPSTEPVKRLKVQLTIEGVRRCQTDAWMNKGVIVHDDRTGEIDMLIPDSFISWAVRFFVSCGADTIVKEPPELVSQIQGWVTQLQQQYKVNE